jgi:hypothetical protein
MWMAGCSRVSWWWLSSTSDGEQDMNTRKTLRVMQIALVAAFVLMCLGEIGFAAIALGVVGVFDVIHAVKREQTLSQWVHKQWGKRTDFIIMLASTLVLWRVSLHFTGSDHVGLGCIMGVIIGHLFWHEGG